MTHPARLWRRLTTDRRGVTAVEFGFVAAPLVLILLATFDLGYRSYMASVLQGVVQAAARRATVGGQTSEQIDAYVQSQITSFSRGATVDITKKSYSDFTNVKQLEKITSDTAPVGTYNAGSVRADGTVVNGDCYDDVNNDWRRDDMGITGLGNADNVVYYQVSVTFTRLVPMHMLGWSDSETVSASTMLRNQPFAASSTATPPNRCYEK